jgi:predicted GIY-YIG superfamily endonuclease
MSTDSSIFLLILSGSNVSIPYERGIAGKIGQILKGIDIQISYRPGQKLQELLKEKRTGSIKDPKEGVYRISCSNCGKSYIGETMRFKERMKDHKGYIRRKEMNKNGLADHCILCDHQPDWNAAKLIKLEPDRIKRKIEESVLII